MRYKDRERMTQRIGRGWLQKARPEKEWPPLPELKPITTKLAKIEPEAK